MDSLVQFVDLPPADCRSFPMPRLNYLVRFVRLFRIFLFCVPDSKDSSVVSMVPITSACSEAVLAGNLSRPLGKENISSEAIWIIIKMNEPFPIQVKIGWFHFA